MHCLNMVPALVPNPGIHSSSTCQLLLTETTTGVETCFPTCLQGLRVKNAQCLRLCFWFSPTPNPLVIQCVYIYSRLLIQLAQATDVPLSNVYRLATEPVQQQSLKDQICPIVIHPPSPHQECQPIIGLLKPYAEFSDAFCKQQAETLLPHRPYDCAIDLLSSSTPS